jgi:hypothetical protein
MASPTFFLHSYLSLAADFQFRIRSSLAASFCIIPSHLFRGLPTGLPPPKQLSRTLFGRRYCSILTPRPAHINLFKRMYVERGTCLYILQISSFHLILHTPLDWVRPNIFQRIFRSKELILFTAPCERIHTSLPYINIPRIRVLYNVTPTLQLTPRHLISGKTEK